MPAGATDLGWQGHRGDDANLARSAKNALGKLK